MIRESDVDESMNRLLSHFKGLVVVRPPASAAELAQLEQLAGPLPRDFTFVYATANGVRVRLEGPSRDEHIACLHDMEHILSDRRTRAAAADLGLVRGDPTAAADWLVLERGPAYGCVIRWNTGGPGASLMASSLSRYLRGWVDYLVERFDVHGRPRVDRLPIEFNARFMAARDPDLARLAACPNVAAWFRELETSVRGGDDFE